MSPLVRFGLILCLILVWSPSFLFIKLAVHELPPLVIVFCRVFIAAILLLIALQFKKRKIPLKWSFWKHSLILATMSSIIPFFLFCYAEKSIDSAMAAILNGSSTLFTVILAYFLHPEDRLNPQKWLGVILSFIGLTIIFFPQIYMGVSSTTTGMLAGLGAAFLYGASHIYAKKYVAGNIPLVAPTAQLLVSAAVLLPLIFIVETPFEIAWPSTKAITGVICLAFFGTFCGFLLYYKLLEHAGPTAISMVACMLPVGGMLLGYLFLGEQLTWLRLTGAGFILTGIMIVNDVISFRGINRAPVKSVAG